MLPAPKSLLFASALVLTGCFSEKVAAPEAEGREEGAASVLIDVGRVGTLSKKSAQPIELARLHISLAAPGEKVLLDTLQMTGASPVVFAKTYSALAAGKSWTLTAKSMDRRDSTIHLGAATFVVENRKTTTVRLDLQSRFSWLTARFFPIRDSVNRVTLQIDNVLRGSRSFERQAHVGDSMILGYDYLAVGSRNIKMQAHGIWNGAQVLLYAADTNLAVVPGADAQHRIELRWVGPRSAPVGAASMTVSLGAAGHVILNGYLKYDHGDGFRYYRVAFEDREDELVRKTKLARLKLRTAVFLADGKSYPEEGGFEIVSLSGIEGGGDLKGLLKPDDMLDKKGWVQFKDLDWTLILDFKKRLRFEEADIEAENFSEFRGKGLLSVQAADDLQGPWYALGQMEVGRLMDGAPFKLKY